MRFLIQLAVVLVGGVVSACAEGGVEVTEAPVVEGILPATLSPGTEARVVGRGFGSDPTSVSVTVAGMGAEVVSVAPDGIAFLVPPACAPSGPVAVAVIVDGQSSDPRTHDFAGPAAQPRRTGAIEVLPAGGATCVRLPTGEGEEYLLGVQNVSRVPGVVRLAAISVRVPGGSAGAPRSVQPPATRRESGAGAVVRQTPRAAPPSGGEGPSPSHLPWATLPRYVTPGDGAIGFHSHAREPVESRTGMGAAGRAAGARSRRSSSIPDDVAPGTRVSVQVVAPGGSCNAPRTITATVRAVGERAVWLQDDANPPGAYGEAQLSSLGGIFDEVIYPADVETFGEPTDLDENARIAIVISQEVNRVGPRLGGFVVGCDLFPRSAVAGSNEGEFVFLAAPDPTGRFGPAYAVTDALAEAPMILGHELVHVIQGGRRLRAGAGIVSLGDFLAEGQAVLGEEIVGHRALGLAGPRSNLGHAVAFGRGERLGTSWYAALFEGLASYFGAVSPTSRTGGAPELCSWLDRGGSPCTGGRPVMFSVTWSLLRWLTERAERLGTGAAEFHRALVDDVSDSGLDLVESVAGAPLEPLLARWAAALYLDDRVEGLEEGLSYAGWNLLEIFEGPRQEAPAWRLVPRLLGPANEPAAARVIAGSTAYYLTAPTGASEMVVWARAAAAERLPPDVQLFIVRTR